MKLIPMFASVAVLCLAGLASADDSRAGTKNHVTAYDSDGTTVLDVDFCPGGSYVKCGKPFRDKIKTRICDEKGKGKHIWYYQVSTGKPSKSTAFCK